MVDEQRKKLSFSNYWQQEQAIWRLYDCVLSKIPPGSILNAKSAQIAELELLWEMIEGPSETATSLSSLCFVQLVADGCAEFDFILSKLLNILPSARSPPHPFITVLISRPDYATHLIQQVNLILLNSTNSSCAEPTAVMQMLESFFKFVLQDPKTSTTELVRQQLFTGLLQTASTLLRYSGKSGKTLGENIVHFLMSTLPSYQIDDKHLSQTTFLVHTLVNWLLEHRDIFNDIHHVKALVNNLLSVCWESQLHGYDMGVSLHLLQRIHHHYPQAFAQICVIPALSCLLLTSPQDYQLQILQVCFSISQDASCMAGSPSTEICNHLLLLLPILLITTSLLKHTSFSVSGKQEDNSNSVVSVARQILQNLEVRVLPISRQLKCEKDRLVVPTPAEFPCSFLSQYMSQMSACSHQLILLLRNEEIRIKCWLESLQRSFSTQKQVLRHVPLMLSAVLVTSAGEIVVDTLNTIAVLAKADPSQGLYFLPLLLYKLCKESDPEVMRHLLYSIPKLATHKFCIGPLLRTIQSIGSQSAGQLKPLSLRLMYKLWQSQNRVFPQFQRVLNANDTQRVGMELNLEIQIAKAACLRDICKERPSQHGADLLSLLSKLLNQNTKPGETVNHPSALVVSLALQALEQLCKAEVVDLCTAWKVLSGKLSQDRRPAVLCSLCQLFRSVPSLATNSQDYQELKNHILSFLWSLTEHEESLVSCAAFDALSLFDPSGFKLIHLPKEIYHPLRAKLLASKTRVRGADDENEDMVAVENPAIDNSIPPGSAYVGLLQTINQQALSGFQKLLSSVIRREADSLPRGFSQSISCATLSHDKNLQSIPEFLMSHYEKSKIPGLTQGLAAGVLFSFEPPFEDHQGKRLRRYLVNCARKYRQMLESLLHEVPVQPSEWHRTLLIPQAWSLFMVRAYEACLEGRKAELDMQYSHGHIQDVEELKTRQMNSWLWVRDQMTEQLKAASRGNPSVQGNSVFALAGLAHAVFLYVQKQNNSGRNTDWLTMVTDTIMVVLDGNYKPKGPTLSWCQQVSSPNSTASSLLARSCAALSLSLLVPSLVTLDTDRIHSMAQLLKQRIPGQAKAGSSAVVQMSCSLGLGLFLSRLYEEHFSDLCGKEGYLLMTTALDVLENAALEQKAENTEGACLGLGLALSFICKESVVDSRVHMTNMYNKLMTMLDEQIEDQRLQSLCFSVALVCVNAFHTGLLSVDEAKNCADKIQKVSDRHCTAYGVSLSYGMLLHGLVSCGHGGVVQLAKDQGEVWRSILESEDPQTSELQRLAALNGVMGLLGSEQSLFIFDYSNAVGIFPSSERNIIKYLQQMFSHPEDVGLCSNLSWLLGQLYAASTSGSMVNAKRVPSDYGYLPEDSTLKQLFDFLVQGGKTGPHVPRFSGKLVPAVLESLISSAEVTLPPVNWAAVLSPILKANFGEETSQLCIQFAVDQARTSTSSFLSSLLSPEVFMGLRDSCRRTLLGNLSRLVYVVSSSKLRRFYEEVLTVPLKNELGPAQVNTVAILEAHLSVLKLLDPPQSVIGWTITALRHIYNTYSCTQDITDHACLTLLAGCLTLVPVKDLENIVDDTQNITTKALVIRCNAIANGKVPMKWLLPCIEGGIVLTAAADISGEKRKEFLCYVSSVVIAADHIFKHDDKSLWFLELISLFKIALQDGSKTSAHRVLLNCFTVLSMVSAAWCTVPLLQALAPFPSNQPTVSQIAACCESLERLPWLLPLTLSTLLREEPWAPVAGKVLDWLVSLLDDPRIPTHLRESALVEDTIISMRGTDTFKKTAVWTDVVGRCHSKFIHQTVNKRTIKPR